MRVLRVVGGLDAEFGGPPVAAANSVIAVAQAGVQTTVVFPHRNAACAHEEPAARALTDAGITWRCFPLNRRFPNFNRTRGVSTDLARWLWRHAGEYDIVHVESPWGLHCLAAVVAARRHRRTTMLTPHACWTRADMKGAHNRLLWAMKRVLLVFYRCSNDGVIFSSELELRDSRRTRTPKNWEVIYHAVAKPKNDLSVPLSADGQDKFFRIGFLGRLHPIKNIESLIESLRLLPSNVVLEAGGDGPPDYVAELQAYARELGVEDRILWRGFIVDKASFYSNVDLIATPSHHENFGLVAAEAMVSGIPVLVSPSTGVAEIVSETGAGAVIFPDGRRIAAAVNRFLKSPALRESCSQRGLTDVSRRISFSEHATALGEYYLRLIAAPIVNTAPS